MATMWTLKIRKLGKAVIFGPPAVLLSVLTLLLLAVVIIIGIVPLICYRALVFILSKCILGSKSKMLTGGGHIVGLQGAYTTSHMYTTVNLVFEGRLTRAQLMQLWEEQIVRKVRPNGKIMFPELQCYVKRFMGYSFYVPDQNFSLENHIKIHHPENSDEIIDPVKFDKISMDLFKCLFARKRSPWETIIVNNFRPDGNPNGKEHSVLIWKFHHVLGDGYAALILLWKGLGATELKPLAPPFQGHNLVLKVIIRLRALVEVIRLIGPMFFYRFYNVDKLFDKNEWKQPKKDQARETILKSLHPIPTSIIKEISRANNVTISTALYSVFVGGFRRMMDAKKRKTPKGIRVGGSFPMPKHADRLTNQSSASFWNTPLIGRNLKTLMQITDTNYKQSVLAYAYSTPAAFVLLNQVPVAWRAIRNLYESHIDFVSVFVSSVPLPSIDITFASCHLVQTYFVLNIDTPYMPATMTALKYKDYFYMTVGIQRDILRTREEISDIQKYVWEELNYLHNLALV